MPLYRRARNDFDEGLPVTGLFITLEGPEGALYFVAFQGKPLPLYFP